MKFPNLREVANNGSNGLKNVFSYIFSGSFLSTFSKMLLIIIGVVFLIMYFLKCYTRHGEKVTVPSIVGMQFEQAEDILSNNGLYAVITDSVFSDSKAPGSILTQDPVENYKVKSGRSIYVTVVRFSKEMEQLEASSLICQGAKQVRSKLNSAGFIIEDEISVTGPHQDEVVKITHNGKVLFECTANREFTEKDNITLPRRSKLVLYVTSGPGEEVGIPQLVGLTVEEAMFRLTTELGLNVGSVISRDGAVLGDTGVYYIYKQYPEFYHGDRMRKGEALDIWIQKEVPTPEDLNPILPEIPD